MTSLTSAVSSESASVTVSPTPSQGSVDTSVVPNVETASPTVPSAASGAEKTDESNLQDAATGK